MEELVVGREAEAAEGKRFVDALRAGPGALLIEGDLGIGKTTLWQEILRTAAGRSYRVLSCRVAAAETKLSFSALTDLLADVGNEFLGELPSPQRRALEVALLRADLERDAPDQRTTFTGFVSALKLLAREAPVVVGIDDAQWLDAASAGALAFAARRLESHPIGVLATVRIVESVPAKTFDQVIPEELVRRLKLGPLSLAALYHIIRSRLEITLPRPTLLRIEAASGGNPFFALEIARVLPDTFSPGEALPIPDDLQELVTARIAALPARTLEALVVASALAQPTVELVDGAGLAKAERVGLVHVRGDGRVAFAHPLFASAVYARVSDERRLQLHRKLAGLVSDVEERARHLALASRGADEHLAAALDEAAEHAAQRGAPEVAAELEEEAAKRTPSAGTVSGARLLRAADQCLRAGDGDRARELAEAVLAAQPPPTTRAHSLQVLAETCYRDRLPEARPLLEEALLCAADDPTRSVELETSLAFVALAVADVPRAEVHARRAAELAERLDDDAALAEALMLIETASYFMARGFDQAAVERALALENPERRVPLQLRPSMNAAQLCLWTCRFDRARELYRELRDRIVEHGQESDLPFVLVHLASSHLFAGELDAAEGYADEALEAAHLVGSELMRGFALVAHAHARARRGDHAAARTDARESLAICERVGWPHGIFAARWALGFLALSEGDHRAALGALEPVVAAVEALGVYERVTAMSLPDAIEALIGTGDLERAERLTESIAECGRRLDRPWGLAESGRCRGLLLAARGDLPEATDTLEQALVDHTRLPMPLEHGRTLLALGCVYRRQRRKRLAKEMLEKALATFGEIGARAWEERAREELSRVGLRRAAPGELTETELRVAELAASGLTNKRIAARAFLTPKSVEDVLARVYRKLGIHSRAELGARMAVRARD